MKRIKKIVKLVLVLTMKLLRIKELLHKSQRTFQMIGPQILKNVSNPIFKRTVVDFDEEFLVIKQQLLDEDN